MLNVRMFYLADPPTDTHSACISYESYNDNYTNSFNRHLLNRNEFASETVRHVHCTRRSLYSSRSRTCVYNVGLLFVCQLWFPTHTHSHDRIRISCITLTTILASIGHSMQPTSTEAVLCCAELSELLHCTHIIVVQFC